MAAKKKVDLERLAALENWGGRMVEFLDSFEASFPEDKIAQEALALQEEGLKLGLVRLPSTFVPKNICKTCGWWGKEFENGYCECPESPMKDLLMGAEEGCSLWQGVG